MKLKCVRKNGLFHVLKTIGTGHVKNISLQTVDFKNTKASNIYTYFFLHKISSIGYGNIPITCVP